MKIWRISQTQNDGWDTYDSAVVAAKSEDEARLVRPGLGDWGDLYLGGWCKWPGDVAVEFIGDGYQGDAGVILASFNAG